MDGLHLTADLEGCDPGASAMTDPVALRTLCLRAVSASGLTAVAELFHAFVPASPGSPGGVTGVVLLAESHLAVHTWPEKAAVTLDVYVCNFGDDNSGRAQALLRVLVEAFGPTGVHHHSLRRGAASGASASI